MHNKNELADHSVFTVIIKYRIGDIYLKTYRNHFWFMLVGLVLKYYYITVSVGRMTIKSLKHASCPQPTFFLFFFWVVLFPFLLSRILFRADFTVSSIIGLYVCL